VPFTPFHMGPGILVKAMLSGSFSLMVFGWAQIVMDLQPLFVLVTGEGHMHGFTHTLVGATLIGVFSAISGKYLGEIGLWIIRFGRCQRISWLTASVSAAIGTYSHVILDALIHADLEPFAPFTSRNPLLGTFSWSGVERLCLYSGVLGAVICLVVAIWQRNTTRH
jgi:membrane-bound metal-dependent hydrolase YbcI (DUF457 family)